MFASVNRILIIKILSGFVFIAAIAGIDVVLRARNAHMKAERYMSWHLNPTLKVESIEAEYAAKIKRLEKQLEKDSVSRREFETAVSELHSEKAFKMKDSAIKNAYYWYQTAAECFPPPLSKWSRDAKEKLPLAEKLWKEESDSLK
ncbi:MAG: hypothetical protein HY746_03905 [Elusimicrobia bacterium]|nr:hypothetical protein [Elusimicrobiota bacterium]